MGGNTLTLTGTNTYANGTNLNSGTIAVGNNSALGASSGTLAMAAGTTLSFTGGGIFDRKIRSASPPAPRRSTPATAARSSTG